MISPVQTTPQISPVIDPRNAAIAAPPPGNLSSSTSAGSEAGRTAELVGRANPTLQFDPAAGIVVVQFRDDSGKVKLSIPNEQQLKAYATSRDEGQQAGNNTIVA